MSRHGKQEVPTGMERKARKVLFGGVVPQPFALHDLEDVVNVEAMGYGNSAVPLFIMKMEV